MHKVRAKGNIRKARAEKRLKKFERGKAMWTTEACKGLIYAVIERAYLDALGKKIYVQSQTEKDRIICKAQAWFRSDSEKFGSFLWYCDLADISVSDIRKKLRENFV
jgi:hypothetical protein